MATEQLALWGNRIANFAILFDTLSVVTCLIAGETTLRYVGFPALLLGFALGTKLLIHEGRRR